MNSAAPCPACARLERLERLAHDPAADPYFLAELRESFVVLHKHQPVEGWCVLWLKDHHEQFGLLPRPRQLRLAEDVADVAAAMHAALPTMRRINYENLGNQVHHIHWHLVPRHANDPDPLNAIWLRPKGELECGAEEQTIARLREAIGTALR